MIVPAHYTEFLKKRDTFGYLASLKENGLCDVCRTSGVYVVDREFLKIMYMPALSPNLLHNLQTKPQMTITIVSALSFESYQFKGNYSAHEKLSAKDESFKNIYLKGLVDVIKEIGFDLDKVLKSKYSALKVEAVIMKVEEIYEQTPKNGTGNKVNLLNLES